MKQVSYPAGLLRRIAAASYDAFLLIALWFAAAVLVLILRDGNAVPAGSVWFTAYLLTVGYLFFGWFWTHGGQTLGMRAWRLQARSIDDGSAPNWLQALRRYLGAYLSWISLIGMLWCLWDPQRRSLQDILSGTELIVLPKAAN